MGKTWLESSVIVASVSHVTRDLAGRLHVDNCLGGTFHTIDFSSPKTRREVIFLAVFSPHLSYRRTSVVIL